MQQPQTIPADPLGRFAALYEALNRDRGIWGDASSLRFAAMSAVTCPGEPDEVATRLRAIADEIKELSGWFGSLNSPLRFIVSTLLLLNGDSAKAFLDEVERVRPLFRRGQRSVDGAARPPIVARGRAPTGRAGRGGREGIVQER